MTRFNDKMTGYHLTVMTAMNALGDENRFRLMRMFTPGASIPLREVVSAMPLSRTATVHHVNILREAGILVAANSGKEVMLSITKDNPVVAKTLSILERT